VQHKLHVVLPGSPNRGVFGGDGAYGEVKSAFDAIVTRAHAEQDWSDRVTFAHPKIGWVRGTGLMGGNDPLVAVVEKHGLRTYSTEEIAVQLLDMATKQAREQAVIAPLDADLTGGLGSTPIDIKALRDEAEKDAELLSGEPSGLSVGDAEAPLRGRGNNGDHPETSAIAGSAATTLKALPTPHIRHQAPVDLADWQGVSAKPEDEIVIVSIGELGPWGSGRTRFEAEMGIRPDGSVELSAGAGARTGVEYGLGHLAGQPGSGLVRRRRQPRARGGYRRALSRRGRGPLRHSPLR
jgi:fatty acid synthase